jgi:hypothetical protein
MKSLVFLVPLTTSMVTSTLPISRPKLCETLHSILMQPENRNQLTMMKFCTRLSKFSDAVRM